MSNFFRRLPLSIKMFLLILFPLALIVYLTFEIYREKAEKADLLKGYVERINISTDLSDLITNLQAERRYSYAYALKKDIDSRAEMDIQRPLTDQVLKKIDAYKDRSLKNYRNYTFLDSLIITREKIDKGLPAGIVMHYYTTAIFRLNTLNLISATNNKYLNPVFDDLNAAKTLNEMSTYLGIIRSNIYNIMYTKDPNVLAVLYGTLGVYDIFNSYEREYLSKASPHALKEYMNIRNNSELKGTLGYIDHTFKKFALDSGYEAEEWWELSGKATDRIRNLQRNLVRSVRTKMNDIYKAEAIGLDRTLIFLIVTMVLVFALMLYVTHVITQMLSNLNKAAEKIAGGAVGVDVPKISNDVIGNLAESISKIDETNKVMAVDADAIGKGNFNVKLLPRSKEDILGNAIIRMKENLRRFTMEIEKSKEQFRQVADTAPVMIWMTDDKKQCNFVNKEWLRFSGRKNEQEMGYGWIEGMHPDDYTRCAEAFDDAFNAREKYYLEYRFKRYDSEYRWLVETGTPRYSTEGKFEGYIGTCIDIHEMKIHEQRKDDFIRMASHELKTPVTSIKGYVQLLLNMYNETGKNGHQLSDTAIQTSLTTIDRQVVKLTRLMTELLDLSRIDTGKLELNMQHFNLNEIVKEAANDVKITSHHNINITADSEYSIYGDRDRIYQVVQNLLTNAVKYSPDHKTIELNVYKVGDNTVGVSIADHGIGIAKENHEKIFERFYRVEGKSEQTYPGFGIGLFIASEIVRRHHGKIFVKSEKGNGSVFTFTLPVK